MGVFSFFIKGYLYPFLTILQCNEFVKMQIPCSVVCYTHLYIVCLATTWDLRFCALAHVGALFIF